MFVVLLRESKLPSSSLSAPASCITSLFLLQFQSSQNLYISHSVRLLSLKAIRGNLKAAKKTLSAVFYCCNVW